MERKLRMGMIGGGRGAFIGAIHRSAALLDGMIDLVCGAFSSNPEIALASGQDLLLPENRIYADYTTMLYSESKLPESQRIDFVSIVTPNHMHFAPAKLALALGFDVIIDKPVTFTSKEAKALATILAGGNQTFVITQTYAGYPMIKQAKAMFQEGLFGKIRKIYVEYPQGWLTTLLEATQQKQAEWRTDPARNGIAGGIGDIGTHAFHLTEYVTGLRVTHICADYDTVVAGRLLDDDATVLLKFNNGAKGVLTCSQIAAGEENNLRIRVYGEKGGVEWQQNDANSLLVKWADQPNQIYRAGTHYLSNLAKQNTRTPAGHPEAYIEAFANIYKSFAQTIIAKSKGEQLTEAMLDVAGIEEGIRGMAFIENVIAAGKSQQKWVPFDV